MYSQKVMDHFMKPRNVGEIEDADGVGKVGNMICGDIMYLYIKVKKQNSDLIIEDIKFKTLGCGAAISTSSITTELVKGKTIEYALTLKDADVTDELDGLPTPKIHCSVLAVKALREAIYDYFSKNNIDIPEDLEKTHKQVQMELDISEKRYKKLQDEIKNKNLKNNEN